MARSEKVQKIRKAKSEKKCNNQIDIRQFYNLYRLCDVKSINLKEKKNGNTKSRRDTYAYNELNFYHPPHAHLIT